MLLFILFQGDKRWQERPERGPGLLRGGGGEEKTYELLPSVNAQQDPHGQETQLPPQRRGPGAPDGVRPAGRGMEKTSTHSAECSSSCF